MSTRIAAINNQEMKGGVKMRTVLSLVAVLLLASSVAWGGAVEMKLTYTFDITAKRVSENTAITISWKTDAKGDYDVTAQLPVMRNGKPAVEGKDVKVVIHQDKRYGVIIPVISGDYSVTPILTTTLKDNALSRTYIYPSVVGMQGGRLTKVTIPNVPKGAKIRIFDESQHLVWEYEMVNDMGQVEYDCSNLSGLNLARGLYIVSIEMPGQKPVRRTIVVRK